MQRSLCRLRSSKKTICNRTKIGKSGNCSAAVFLIGQMFSGNTGLGTARRRFIRSSFENKGKSLDTLPSSFGQSQRRGIFGTTLPVFRGFASTLLNDVPVWRVDFSTKPCKKPLGVDSSLPSCTARNFWYRTIFRRAGNLPTIRLSCGTVGTCRFPCEATALCTTN